MDNPDDDPRRGGIDIAISDDSTPNSRQSDDEGGGRPAGVTSLLELMTSAFGASGDQTGHTRGNGGGGGMRIIINGPRGMRSVQLGGPNTLGQGGSPMHDGSVPRLSEYALPHGFHVFGYFNAFKATLLQERENLQTLTEVP